MRKSTPRIRSVTRKSDGARVSVFPSPEQPKSVQGKQLIEDAVQLSKQGDGTPIHGFVIVTWDETGRREHAYGWKNQLVIDAQLIPQFVAEGLKNAFRASEITGRF